MLQNEIDTVYLIIGKAILKRMTDGISEEEIRSMIEKDIEQAGLITGTCESCKHHNDDRYDEPCYSCSHTKDDNWQGKE